MKGTLILSGLLATTVSAHIQMSKPYPIRSPLNKDAKGQKDYSYTNPLSTSGSDYPCKGYADDDFEAVATWQPGSSQEIQLEGSAVHGGGSCQLALTYDKGKTFKVIQSMEGDCPIDKKYEFEVPSDAPSGDALFAWTWFNKVGNREMYMNCAMITIGGSGNREAKEKNTKKEHNNNNKSNNQTPNNKPNSHTTNAKSSFDSLPDLFLANVDQAGKCVTIEGEPVHFPKPGPKLIGKAEGPGYKCSEHAPFLDGDSNSKSTSTSSKSETKSEAKPTTTGTSSSTSKSETKPTTESEKKSSATSTSSSTATKEASKIAKVFGTPSAAADSRVFSTEASTNNQFVNYVGQWSCHSGDIICSPDGLSFAMCTHGKPIFMGPVAAGTICRWGVITARH
ncbi:hypothetical protein N7519_005134 [Penicillium mononematosum]|uniref:uncharacterized protein n=1 Tax=Penicillium mononematosum TaxID=268346 RepID=UPI002547AC67|nr:uncharacterized protein N7519_005134 [Penicillium mononematosum]KAJ6183833.1 hypothetical protein N7519_005134 [Penicillium mononematosum]